MMSELYDDIEFLRETFESIEPTPSQQQEWRAEMQRAAHQLLTDATSQQRDPLPMRLLIAAGLAAVISVATLLISPLDSLTLKGRMASVSTSISDVQPFEFMTSNDASNKVSVDTPAQDPQTVDFSWQSIIDDVKATIPAPSVDLRQELEQLTTMLTQPFVKESMRDKTSL